MSRYAIIGSLALSAILAGTAHSQPAADQTNTCFFTSQFQHWKAPNDHTIFISVVPNRYYRLDLSTKCPELLWPGSHLVTVFRGTTSICSATDWDLKVSQSPNGISVACIVSKMTQLSPSDVDAIPPQFKPSRP